MFHNYKSMNPYDSSGMLNSNISHEKTSSTLETAINILDRFAGVAHIFLVSRILKSLDNAFPLLY